MPLGAYPMVLDIAHIADGFGFDLVCFIIPFIKQLRPYGKQGVVFIAAVRTGRNGKELFCNGTFPCVSAHTFPDDHSGITRAYFICGFLIVFRPVGDKLRVSLSEGALAVFAADLAVSSSDSFIGAFVFNVPVLADPFASYGGLESDFICWIWIIPGILGKEIRKVIIRTISI